DVIGDLGGNARPVDRVDRGQSQVVAKAGVGEHCLYEVLAVVEGSLDGNVANVWRQHGRHLPALDGAGAAVGMQDHDVDAIATGTGLDRRRTGISGGGPDDGHALVALGQDIV